jgi:hypothetical protein
MQLHCRTKWSVLSDIHMDYQANVRVQKIQGGNKLLRWTRHSARK